MECARGGIRTRNASRRMSLPIRRLRGRRQRAGVRSTSSARDIRCAVPYASPIGSSASSVEADGIPQPGEVWADGALLARVGADVGDLLSVGSPDLRVSAVLTYRPDQSIGFASLAPSLLMNIGDVGGNRPDRRGQPRQLRAAGCRRRDAPVAAFNDAIEDQLPDSVRVRSQEESSERAYTAADRAQRFLSLTAVISLLLSAVAVAMSARRFAHRRMDTVALMKSLGATQGFVIAVALIQLAAARPARRAASAALPASSRKNCCRACWPA